jgi:NitT/TauT family transport system permease protein
MWHGFGDSLEGRRMTKRRLLTSVLPPLVLLAAVILLWDLAVIAFRLPNYYLPRPGRVWLAAQEHAGELAGATGLTAAAALAGFALSVAIGFLVALGFSQSRIVRSSMYPYAIFLQTVPIVAIAPLVILWFGNGFQSVVIVSFVISVFPIITNATTGLTTVPPTLLELFEMYNASRWQTLWKLRVPHSVTYLVTGAKISCGLSVIGAIVGEHFAGFGAKYLGLGYLIFQSAGLLQTDYQFAAVLCSTLLGILIFGAVNVVGSTFLSRWQSTESTARIQGAA